LDRTYPKVDLFQNNEVMAMFLFKRPASVTEWLPSRTVEVADDTLEANRFEFQCRPSDLSSPQSLGST